VAIVLVHREFFADPIAVRRHRKPEYISNWRQFEQSGRVIGDSGAQVKILEFADLQCPYCRRFNRTLRTTMERFPGKVAIVFVHLPIPGHKLALPAARAVECAHGQGKFGDFVNLLYDNQDSLADKSSLDVRTWTSYASRAGLRDRVGFAHCMADTLTPPAVKAGRELARQLGVTATPTVIINGWRYPIPPSDSELVRRVSELIAGKNSRPFLKRVFGLQ